MKERTCRIEYEMRKVFPLRQVLLVNQNKLKKLPETLGNLKRLQTLDVSHNNLKELPLSLGSLVRMRSLDVKANPKLNKLPKTLGKAQALEKLQLDGESFVYPAKDVSCRGLEAIMRFLCKGEENSIVFCSLCSGSFHVPLWSWSWPCPSCPPSPDPFPQP